MMKPKIDLLYFKGCPNVEEARENITKALKSLSLPEEWNEIDVEDPKTNVNLKGFPSPTILISGVDVETGLSKTEGTQSCQVTGAPSVQKIREKLLSAVGRSPKKGLWAVLTPLPASLLAVFPTAFCPACYPDLAGIVSSAGWGVFASDPVIKPLTVVFLLIALFGLFYQGYQIKRFLPFVLGLFGAIGIYAGHYFLFSQPLIYASVVILIGVSIWNLVNRKKAVLTREACSSCKPKGG